MHCTTESQTDITHAKTITQINYLNRSQSALVCSAINPPIDGPFRKASYSSLSVLAHCSDDDQWSVTVSIKAQ